MCSSDLIVPMDTARLATGGDIGSAPTVPELIEHALNVREPIASAARSGIPQAHAQQLEAPDHIQVEQRVCVMDSTIATRPTRLPPQIEGADHHLRRIGQAVMQSRKLTRPESTSPMRVFQFTSQTRLALGGPM